MRQILFAAAIALVTSILLTPLLIRAFVRQGFGQEIRDDGPESHQSKRGTPTMGGVAILIGLWAGYWGSHLLGAGDENGTGPTASGMLVLGLATALGLVGFTDDFIKLRKQRNLGLNATGKYIGQISAGLIFAVLCLQFHNSRGQTPGSAQLSDVRDISTLTLGTMGFLIFVCIIVVAWSNAVNLTDGLDGLAAGSMGLVLGSYVIITFWQYRNSCLEPTKGCYDVRDPLDLALICAAGAGACIGFLWWNAAPAKIFMGDTGSLALGGLVAGLSVTTRTELLMVVIGALFVAEAASVVLQIAVFKTTRRRPFHMAPFHHHFELAGWAETTVIIRFWLMAGIAAAVGVGLFTNEYLQAHGL